MRWSLPEHNFAQSMHQGQRDVATILIPGLYCEWVKKGSRWMLSQWHVPRASGPKYMLYRHSFPCTYLQRVRPMQKTLLWVLQRNVLMLHATFVALALGWASYLALDEGVCKNDLPLLSDSLAPQIKGLHGGDDNGCWGSAQLAGQWLSLHLPEKSWLTAATTLWCRVQSLSSRPPGEGLTAGRPVFSQFKMFIICVGVRTQTPLSANLW